MASKATNKIRQVVMFGLALAVLVVGDWVFSESEIGLRVENTRWGMNLLYYSEFLSRAPKSVQLELETEVHDKTHGERTIAPNLAPGSGIYEDAVEVTSLDTPVDSVLHYSTDGSLPTRRHPRFSGRLTVTESCVVRFKAFESGRLSSETATATYIIGEPQTLPVVSLVLDPVYLWDKYAGIYVDYNYRQRGRAWERPVDFTILSPTSAEVLQVEGKVRLHGHSSREQPKKCFRIYLAPGESSLRSWFGTEAEQISVSQSEWVLRHSVHGTLYHDRLAQRISMQIGLLGSSSIPCVLYLNGELWGVYELTERLNSQFLEGKVPGKAFTLLHGGTLDQLRRISGDDDNWREIYAFVESHDLAEDDAFNRIAEQIDLDNLIDFWIVNIFSGDVDRPDTNVVLFRSDVGDGRWRFVPYDYDGGFSYGGAFSVHDDTFAWNLRARPRMDIKRYGTDTERHVRSALLFRKLSENRGFQARFRDRCLELLGSVLSAESLLSTFDDLLAEREGTREVEILRFAQEPPDEAEASYDQHIKYIREFLAQRPDVIRQLLLEHFPE